VKFSPSVYIHILWNPSGGSRRVGKLGLVRFEPGFYVYVGSGGVNALARVKRHLRPDKPRHWHIDYVTTGRGRMNPIDSYIFPRRNECRLARQLGRRLTVVRGFGSSDCRCVGHLFFAADLEALLRALEPLTARFRA